MDPLIGLAAAGIAVGAASSIYNWVAGNANAEAKRKQLAAQRDNALADLSVQYAQGQRQITQANAGQAVDYAQRGVTGSLAAENLDAAGTQRNTDLETWNTTQQRNIQTAYDAGLSDINSQISQFNLDSATGLVGTGLSAAALLVKAGAFNQPAASTGLGSGFNPNDPSWSGLNGRGIGGYSWKL